jgi:hypothetical protein
LARNRAGYCNSERNDSRWKIRKHEFACFCEKTMRYDFLFVSKPVKLRGGVGSPPNAMAIF